MILPMYPSRKQPRNRAQLPKDVAGEVFLFLCRKLQNYDSSATCQPTQLRRWTIGFVDRTAGEQETQRDWHSCYDAEDCRLYPPAQGRNQSCDRKRIFRQTPAIDCLDEAVYYCFGHWQPGPRQRLTATTNRAVSAAGCSCLCEVPFAIRSSSPFHSQRFLLCCCCCYALVLSLWW